MLTNAEKGAAFQALHVRNGAFIIPNPWDIGTTRLLAHLGFEALATTSAGYAFSVGQQDSTIGRDETMAHVAAIVSATDLPVSADLENGFGDAPESVAETIKLAAEAGLVGGSIEDVPGRVGCAPYELEHAADRIRAAAEVVRGLPFRFTLTARAENYLVGRPDLHDQVNIVSINGEALYRHDRWFSRGTLLARVVPYAAVELDTGCCLLAASTAGTRSTLIRDFTTYPRTPVCAGSAASDFESCSVTIRISAPGNCS